MASDMGKCHFLLLLKHLDLDVLIGKNVDPMDFSWSWRH